MPPSAISNVPLPQHPEIAREIEEKLLHSLADLNSQSINTSVVMTVKNDRGDLIGGVTGSTSYGWLLVKTLWVSVDQRGAGLGRKLMQTVEEKARHLDCHSAWLDTSNSQAREFYLRLGYVDFGVLKNGLENEPKKHHRWFMKKPI